MYDADRAIHVVEDHRIVLAKSRNTQGLPRRQAKAYGQELVRRLRHPHLGCRHVPPPVQKGDHPERYGQQYGL